MKAGTIRRSVVACIAAYALVVHSLLMGLATAPRTADGAQADLLAALQVICAAHASTNPDAPSTPQDHHQPPHCALCGIGHCGIALPGNAPLLAPAIQTAAAPGLPSLLSRPLPILPGSARARAPPLLA
jgi:hypothetical protein